MTACLVGNGVKLLDGRRIVPVGKGDGASRPSRPASNSSRCDDS